MNEHLPGLITVGCIVRYGDCDDATYRRYSRYWWWPVCSLPLIYCLLPLPRCAVYYRTPFTALRDLRWFILPRLFYQQPILTVVEPSLPAIVYFTIPTDVCIAVTPHHA